MAEQFRIAYDTALKRPGCVLIQAVLGGIDGWAFTSRFPVETWLLAPTPDMHVYAVTEAQLDRLAEITARAMRAPSTTTEQTT